MDEAGDKTWAVREMPAAERTMALEAAKRARQPMGLWLAGAIRAYVAQERGDGGGRGALLVPQPSPEDWERVIRLHAMLADRSEQKVSDRWALEIAAKLSAQIGLDIKPRPFVRRRRRIKEPTLRMIGADGHD
jgi:hypothetical protein